MVPELLEGFTLAFPRKVRLQGKNLIVRATPKAEGKVGVVTLGGSGHEPGLSGFVGEGLLDISVAGEIFSAPGAPAVAEAIRSVDHGAGALLIILNHSGDVLSGNMALETVRRQGRKVESVLTHEDISTGPKGRHEEGRGLVGFLPVFKVAGAAAEQGMPLSEVHGIAERMSQNMRISPLPLNLRLIRLPAASLAIPISLWAKTKWRSAWASTARQVCIEAR